VRNSLQSISKEENVKRRIAGLAVLVSAILLVAMGCNQPTEPTQPGPEMTSISVTALDSANGTYLSAPFTVKAIDSSGTATNFTATSNPYSISVLSGADYDLVVSKSGRAQDRHEDIHAGSSAIKQAFILHTLEQSTFAAESPTITAFEYTASADPAAADAVWTPIASGASLDFSAVTGFRVNATATAEMDATSWSGPGIIMGVDQLPGTFSSVAATASASSYDLAKNLFTATARFGNTTPSILPGAHTLSVVVYDRSSNRVERNVTVTATAAAAAGADLSADFIQSLTADFRIYGLSREYFSKGASTDALRATATGSVSCRTQITFKVQDAASAGNAVPILGYKVERSADSGATWTVVGTKTYSAANTGSSGTHTFYDTDAFLNQDDSYLYKVTAFTDGTHTLSATTGSAVKFLPAFTASLVGPTNKGAVSAAAGTPDLSFSISDASLWSSSVSDRYYFAPLIRDRAGNVVFYGEFIYQFADDSLLLRYGNSYYSVVDNLGGVISDYITFAPATGVVTLKSALFNDLTNWWSGTLPAYATGVTYEWDIFGNCTSTNGLGKSDSMTASWFQKNGTNAVSKSYADVYQNGQETLNGWFSFTAN
jgi:hypothetical protein